MKIIETSIPGLIVFEPTPSRDERGYFTRTMDVNVLSEAGIDPAGFKQENQSRSYQGVVRGMHGRMNEGEAKLVRCAHGAVLDIAIDTRVGSRRSARWRPSCSTTRSVGRSTSREASSTATRH